MEMEWNGIFEREISNRRDSEQEPNEESRTRINKSSIVDKLEIELML